MVVAWLTAWWKRASMCDLITMQGGIMARTSPYTTMIMLDADTTLATVMGWMGDRYGPGDDANMISLGEHDVRWGYRVGVSRSSRLYVVICTDDPEIHADCVLSW